MQAGDYRHTITIQTRENEKWRDLATVHARVNSISGSEYWAAAAVQAQNTMNFDMRYSRRIADLVPQDCRIKFGGHIYDVQSIDDFEFKHKSLRMKGVRINGR